MRWWATHPVLHSLVPGNLTIAPIKKYHHLPCIYRVLCAELSSTNYSETAISYVLLFPVNKLLAPLLIWFIQPTGIAALVVEFWHEEYSNTGPISIRHSISTHQITWHHVLKLSSFAKICTLIHCSVKTPPALCSIFTSLLVHLGWKLASATPQKIVIDSGFILSLQKHLVWVNSSDPLLSDLHPSLSNLDHVRWYINSLCNELFPHGMGLHLRLSPG